MNKQIRYFSILFCLVCLAAWRPSRSQSISLAGIWQFRIDPLETGIQEHGVRPATAFANEILLPGSTDEGGYGFKNNTVTSLRLTRLFQYEGAAWYEKKVFVPAGWKDKVIQLFLERAHWQTEVWVNGIRAGKRESLSVPHLYDISSLLKAGRENTIRIRVNNSKIYDIGSPHAISEETQTNWNGVIGKLELRAFDKVHIAKVQVYPDVRGKQVQVKVAIINTTGHAVKGTISLRVADDDGYQGMVKEITFSGKDSLLRGKTTLSMGGKVKLWDEFHPSLYRLHVLLKADDHSLDEDSVVFGMRNFSVSGTQFMINGRPVFIRADVNSAESPLTGYPAMDVDHWMHVFRVCKDYGLNAMRFHSWCPPEAAFKAADRMGFYLQVENPDWRFNIGKDTAANRFLTEEADRILKAYGNHPSFMMFCEGNELVGPGRDTFLTSLIDRWKREDPRHLYTGSSGYPVMPDDDYIDLYGPRAQHWKEGLKGRLNAAPYRTDFDYSDVVSKYDKPVVSHEVGQWCMYPDFNQIAKYTGILKPYNYALFRESLGDHHMLDQASQFMMASGKFQVILKKEELEALLRTPGLGGYQLLQLQDFPGQGTAPVGVVDIFWDPKPYVTAEQFRQFQSPRVLLVRSPSFIFTNDETFKAVAEIANYGEGKMKNAVIGWKLTFGDGKPFDKGSFSKSDISVGGPVALGTISSSLKGIDKATRLDLTLALKGSDITNHWSIWVYPKKLPPTDTTNFLVAHAFNQSVKDVLQQGGRVLLLADTSEINSDLSPSFSGISWNTVWSGTPPDKLGILCDPAHPALKDFPTQYYSNWQWWDLVRHSRPMKLNDLPASFRPIIQMIPDWNKNNKIGLLFEAKVGKGKLLMTSMDLTKRMDERPVARQMLYSLEKYIGSDAFDPKVEISFQQISGLFKIIR